MEQFFASWKKTPRHHTTLTHKFALEHRDMKARGWELAPRVARKDGSLECEYPERYCVPSKFDPKAVRESSLRSYYAPRWYKTAWKYCGAHTLDRLMKFDTLLVNTLVDTFVRIEPRMRLEEYLEQVLLSPEEVDCSAGQEAQHGSEREPSSPQEP